MKMIEGNKKDKTLSILKGCLILIKPNSKNAKIIQESLKFFEAQTEKDYSWIIVPWASSKHSTNLPSALLRRRLAHAIDYFDGNLIYTGEKSTKYFLVEILVENQITSWSLLEALINRYNSTEIIAIKRKKKMRNLREARNELKQKVFKLNQLIKNVQKGVMSGYFDTILASHLTSGLATKTTADFDKALAELKGKEQEKIINIINSFLLLDLLAPIKIRMDESGEKYLKKDKFTIFYKEGGKLEFLRIEKK